MMRMYLISDNIDTLTGMRLAGVEGVIVHEREALKTELDRVLSDKTIGILLILSLIHILSHRPKCMALRTMYDPLCRRYN